MQTLLETVAVGHSSIRAVLTIAVLSISMGCQPDPVSPPLQSAIAEIRILVEDEQFDEAIKSTTSLVARIEEAQGLSADPVSDLVDLLLTACSESRLCLQRDVQDQAELLIQMKARLLGSEHVSLVSSWTALGQLRLQSGEFDKARDHFERAILIGEKKLGKSHLEIGDALRGLANAFIEIGSFSKAAELFERELAIVRREYGTGHLNVARNLYGQARCSVQTGRYEEAKKLYSEALRIAQREIGPDHPRVAWILNGLANAHDLIGEYVEAKDSYEQALSIAEKRLGSEDPFVADCLNNLGLVLQSLGDYLEARGAFERALEISEKALGPTHPDVATTLANLAETLDLMDDAGAVESLYQRALGIRETAFGRDSAAVAETLHAIGFLRLRRGDYRGANHPFERAVSIWDKLPEHPDFVEALNGLALVRQDQGKLQEARELLERSLEFAQASLGEGHPSMAKVLGDLAGVLARLGETASALKTALRSEKVARNHLRLTARFLPEQLSLRYAKTRSSSLDLALWLAASSRNPEMKRQALDALIRSRAVVLDEMAWRHRTLSDDTDQQAARLADDLKAASRRLANLVVRGPHTQEKPQDYSNLLSAARREKELAERTLAEKTGRHGKIGSRQQDVGLDKVKSHLPQGAALITYARYNHPSLAPGSALSEVNTSSYVAFVLRSGRDEPSAVPLGPAREIDALVSRWSTEVSRLHDEQLVQATGIELRKLLWDPLSTSIGEVDHLFVVLDDRLHLVSLPALPNGDGSYLLESGPVFALLSTERDIVPTGAGQTTGDGIFVLGGAAFEDRTAANPSASKDADGQVGKAASSSGARRSACEDFRAMRFEALPGSAREAEEISELWRQRFASQRGGNQKVVHVTGSTASEAAFKRLAEGKRVVHLATHGFFLGGDCTSSTGQPRGLGGLSSPQEIETRSFLDENPLLHSGLALAGANQRETAGPDEEDGILTAEELASLDLSATELAVLSACDTGAGKVESGEGVLGLRRALHIAGVRTTIMSLWAAEDMAARELMKGFYEQYLFRGASPAVALREAGLQVLNRRRLERRSPHPFYWAGWVAVGSSPTRE